IQIVAAMIGQLLLGELSGNPNLGLAVRKLDLPRHHTDDGTLLVVQRNFSSDNLGIAAKPSQPETMTQDRNMRRAGNIIPRSKVAAEKYTHAQEGKKVCRNFFSVELFWGSISREIEVAAIRKRSHVFENLVSRFPVGKITWGGSVFRKSISGGVFPDHYEPIRIAIRKRADQYSVGDAEDGGVRGNS